MIPIPLVQPKEAHAAVDAEAKFDYEFDYQITRELGRGAYAKVYEAFETKTNKKVAIKKFIKALVHAHLAQYCIREIEILTSGNHQNIVKMHHVTRSKNSVYLIMEYTPSDLRKLIHSTSYLEPEEVKKLMYEMLVALNYLHSAKIVHRDIKPGNILTTAEKNIKLCDFGLARSIRGLKINSYDFDDIYRREYAISSDKYLSLAATDIGESMEEITEDLDEHVKVNTICSISDHFSKDTRGPHTMKPIIKMKPGTSIGVQEEIKAPVKLGGRISVSMRRAEFIKSLKPDPNMERELTSHVASRWYRAPEVILLEKVYFTSVDIWGAGCVFAELLQTILANCPDVKARHAFFPGTCCFPLSPQLKDTAKEEVKQELGDKDQIVAIVDILGSPSESDISFVTDYGAKQYIQGLPQQKKKSLASIFPASDKDALALLGRMLEFSPFMRITAKEALRHPYFKSLRNKDSETERGPMAIESEVPEATAISKLMLICDQAKYTP